MRIKMQQAIEHKTTEEAFTEFIKYCKIKNLARDSIIYYENCFKSFTKFYPTQNSINDVSLPTIQDYILFQKQLNISPIAINSNLRGTRAFLYYCMKLGYLNKFRIELIKAEKKVKQVYTDAELNLLLRKPNLKQCSFSEYRNWVIVNYALGTGNRVSTIINIRTRDIDFDNGFITLNKTKNKKQQIVPLSITLSSILSEYLSYRKGQPDDFLFCNSFSNPLSDRTLQGDIARYNKKRGVMKTSMHLFRHTFAKKWILAGGDIFRLQKLLGHSSLEIVKEYVNMFSDDLKQNYDKFNPLEQMTQKSSFIKIS